MAHICRHKPCGKTYHHVPKSSVIRVSKTSTHYCSIECRNAERKHKRTLVNKVYKCGSKDRLIASDPNDIDWVVRTRGMQIMNNAKYRGKDFELTHEELKTFFKQDCHYCGTPLNNLNLDRRDNSIGYVFSNVLPCCPTCNIMKRTMTYEDFAEQCIKIAQNFLT